MVSNRWFRVLCFFLSFAILFACAPSVVRADSQNVPCYSVTAGLQYEVDASVVSAWDTHANLEFAITNTGNETIHNWYFTFDLPYAIEGIWNASVYDTDFTGVYTIKNAGSNQDILPGNSVSFGMTVASLNEQPVENLPTFYLLNTLEKIVDSSRYSLTYQEYSNWGTGFNGALVLSNTSSADIEDWKMSFSSNRGILEAYGVDFGANENGYEISNNGSNQNIVVGSNVNMTITGNDHNISEGLEITDATLYTIGCVYGLTDDNDLNGITDYIDFINSQTENPDITPTPTPIPTETPTNTPTPNTTIVPTPEPTPTPEPDQDSDKDGIPDYHELQIGTDPNSSDSDSDGINDGEEIVLGMNPLSNDSNGDGIIDSQEDEDEDGLTLAQELEIGTNPIAFDTDWDGLSDYDEYVTYTTEPLEYDTDKDGICDGDEVRMGKNPKDSSDKETLLVQEKAEDVDDVITKVDVQIELANDINTVLHIDDVCNVDAFTTELVGRVGSPVSFECEEAFETATIVFHYDDTKLGDTLEEDLAVLWYDKDDGFYIIQEQAIQDISNNTITLAVDHFSTYVLVDKMIWNDIPNIEYDYSADDLHFDYYVAINVSEGMELTDRSNAVVAVENLIDNMKDGDRICVIYFGTTDLTTAQLVEKKDSSGINQLESQVRYYAMNLDFTLGFYGSYRRAFSATSGVITKHSDYVDNQRVLFILSNDDDMIHAVNYSIDMSNYMQISNFVSGFVMLREGDESMTDYGWKYADETGSDYYKYPSFDNLPLEFVQNYKNNLAWSTDRDFDNIPDFLEIQGIMTTNGRIYYSDPDSSDSDSDSSSDDEEIGLIYTITRSMNGQSISIALNNCIVYTNNTGTVDSNSQFWFMKHYVDQLSPSQKMIICVSKSNPNVPDSDNDGISDFRDATPNYANGKVCYIFVGEDKAGSDAISSMVEPYQHVFKENEKKVITVYLNEGEGSEWDAKLEELFGRDVSTHEDIIYAFQLMNIDLSQDHLTPKIAFSGVDTLVVMAHGSNCLIDFGGSNRSEEQIQIFEIIGDNGSHNLTPDKWPCTVDILDIQACLCACDGDIDGISRTMSIARGFAENEKIKKVYGWSGLSIFDPPGGLQLGMSLNIFPNGCNISPLYPSEGHGEYYEYTTDSNGTIQRKSLGFIVLPLQYS